MANMTAGAVPLVMAERTGAGEPFLRRWWAHYGDVATSRDFLAAAATLLVTLVSWGLYVTQGPSPAVTALGIAGAVIGGSVIAWGAIGGLLRREMNVDELVTVAIAASLVVGEYWGAALVAFMMLFGKVLEDVTAARAEHAIEGLGKLVPAMAHVKDGRGGERLVPVAEVRIGDVIVVRPGERLPVDGQIVAGRAALEEAAITGESLPVDKTAGDEVFAGTLATGGALEVRAVRTGEATALGRIVTLVKEAEADRATIVRLADRWATWFTPAVLTLAALVYLWRREVLPAISVLVVACPCALVLATPTAVVAGIARAARRGILLRGGSRLEAAGQVDAVCLDKTGTLTLGRPVVQRVVTFGDLDEGTVLRYAAAAERFSEHPLARAVIEAAERLPAQHEVSAMPAANFEAIAGKGVAARAMRRAPALAGAGHTAAISGQGIQEAAAEAAIVLAGRPEFMAERGVAWPAEAQAAVEEIEAAGQSPLVVAIDGRLAGVIAVADAPRAEARAAIARLRANGVRQVVLLTGDRAGAARAVAAAVGIAPEDVHAGLLPEEKVAWVKRLRSEGHRVAMIGDGVNDAPALAAADVGVAMGIGGTDLAMATADVVLMTDDLRQAAAAIQLSRHTLRTIRQNLVFAALWNVAAVALVVFGGLGIVAGALVHNAGSVAVVLNAARLVGARLDDR
jgi:Cd2+/Zn2+-exporting ATPase